MNYKSILTFLLVNLLWHYSGYTQQAEVRYSVPDEPWDENFGNHRAIINVEQSSDAVHLDFLWRRHDLKPENHRLIIINAKTGEIIKNIYRIQIDQERCEIVFGPVAATGVYYFYYLPYQPELKQYAPGPYLTPEEAPDKDWTSRHNLYKTGRQFVDVKEVKVEEIQARRAFHSFYPMEVTATVMEVSNYLQKHQSDFLLFPEDRVYPIRMLDVLPLRWIKRSPGSIFKGVAQKNEYYTLQIGVYAAQKNLRDIRLIFSDIKDKNGNEIPASAFTCFNTNGVDTRGKPFTKKIDLAKEGIQPLWIGVDIPSNAIPGIYEGNIGVQTQNAGQQVIPVRLQIEDKLLADRGDGETWRHSRLRWLNSSLGIADQPTLDYESLKLHNESIVATGKTVQLSSTGLPALIQTPLANNILATPIRFTVEVNNKIHLLKYKPLEFVEQKPGSVSWSTSSESDSFFVECIAKMEFDGRMHYRYKLTAKKSIYIQDIRLELPFKKEFATYMVGMGRMGGYTPPSHISRWIKTEDSFWIGNTLGGVQCELRGGQYHGPLLNLYQPNPPASWYNGMNGGFRVDSNDSVVTASAYSGARDMQAGQSVEYEFALLITPVKPFDTKKQFFNRYYHGTFPTPEVIANGGNVMNIHHATEFNPYINYPFIAQKKMKEIVEEWHKKNWKVKIYYTVRELSNHLTEIWALRSLGNEVLAGGRGGGYQWLQEHLVTGYTPQWYTHIGNGMVDAAILNGSESRWYNYYIEGLNWLMKNMDIDGLYLDDVSFDRHIIQRMRRVMEMTKPGCMIDLHSNTAFSLGSANQNMEMFPYIDKTWFGEGFNFDLMPADFWLTEVSGIPFGIPNDILMHMSVNNKRGMIYAMTHRGFYPIWKLWDEFGISDSKMVGYWDAHPLVQTNNEQIKATSYVKSGSVLIVLGSWSNQKEKVKLQLDWKRLGLEPNKVKLRSPEIEGYQRSREINMSETLTIEPKNDLIIIISKR